MIKQRAPVVHTEVEFSQVYRDQPLFAEIDTHLRAKGFELIDLIKFGHNTYAELPSRRTASRLLWSDAIYFRNVDAMSALSAPKLLRAAFETAGVKPTARAEALSLEKSAALFRALSEQGAVI